MGIRYEKRVIENGLFEYEGNFYTFTGLRTAVMTAWKSWLGKIKKAGSLPNIRKTSGKNIGRDKAKLLVRLYFFALRKY